MVTARKKGALDKVLVEGGYNPNDIRELVREVYGKAGEILFDLKAGGRITIRLAGGECTDFKYLDRALSKTRYKDDPVAALWEVLFFREVRRIKIHFFCFSCSYSTYTRKARLQYQPGIEHIP